MAKTRTSFVCRACGAMQPRWMGKCPDCNEWDSLDEVKSGGAGAAQDPHRGAAAVEAGEAVAVPINNA